MCSLTLPFGHGTPSTAFSFHHLRNPISHTLPQLPLTALHAPNLLPLRYYRSKHISFTSIRMAFSFIVARQPNRHPYASAMANWPDGERTNDQRKSPL